MSGRNRNPMVMGLIGGEPGMVRACIQCGSTDRRKAHNGAKFGPCRKCDAAQSKRYRDANPEYSRQSGKDRYYARKELPLP